MKALEDHVAQDIRRIDKLIRQIWTLQDIRPTKVVVDKQESRIKVLEDRDARGTMHSAEELQKQNR